MKLKVGIIGCGSIANGKHMPALSVLSTVEMVAFCDMDEEKAQNAKYKFGIPDAKVYTDYHELLKDKTIDVIHVCTPNKSHCAITVDSLDAGKHVMCEKPMSKTSAEAKEMLEAAKRSGKKLTIGYQNRFRSDSQYLSDICKNDELGEIYFAKAHALRRRAVPTWGVFLNEDEQGGGPLIDIGTHALDLTLWLMNNYKPKYVVGNVYHELSKNENAANAFGSWNLEEFNVEDSAFGFVTMENGATIVIESSWALNTLDVGEAQTTLCGTNGGADMKSGLRINGEAFGRLYETKIDTQVGGVAYSDGNAETCEMIEARQWINAIMNNTDPLVKPEEALVVTQILEAIYESSKTKQPVYFD